MCTNDIESIEHENLEDRENRKNKIFVIDSRLNLFKFQIDSNCKVLDQCNLHNFKNIANEIEAQVRDKDFVRICATDRCLTINGKTFNYRTGYQWDFVCNFTEFVYESILFS